VVTKHAHKNGMKDNARARAVVVLDAVLHDGRSLSAGLLLAESGMVERALVMELSYGTLRWLPRLESIAALMLHKPLRDKDRDIYYLILIGLYQLIYMRVPPYAVVDETVAVSRGLGKAWASGLVNSMLRNFQRKRQAIESSLSEDVDATYAHPVWLRKAIEQAWPDDWVSIVTVNQMRPPMVLRVNLTRQSRQDYLRQLKELGLAAIPHAHVGSAVVLEQPVDVSQLPGFDSGCVSVQDAAAQLAPTLLDLKPGLRVLDACAAPGGKTGHLFEIEPSLDVVALDIDSGRLQRVAENLQRLDYIAKLVCGDAVDTTSWWDGELFDRVLLDAPCSATGVIRRHPDIKYLRKPDDITALMKTQVLIIQSLWPLLKPGGRLVYATCSILPQENNVHLAQFISTHEDAVEIKIDAEWGRAMSVGRQILNGSYQESSESMDGFFYACLVKQS